MSQMNRSVTFALVIGILVMIGTVLWLYHEFHGESDLGEGVLSSKAVPKPDRLGKVEPSNRYVGVVVEADPVIIEPTLDARASLLDQMAFRASLEEFRENQRLAHLALSCFEFEDFKAMANQYESSGWVFYPDKSACHTSHLEKLLNDVRDTSEHRVGYEVIKLHMEVAQTILVRGTLAREELGEVDKPSLGVWTNAGEMWNQWRVNEAQQRLLALNAAKAAVGHCEDPQFKMLIVQAWENTLRRGQPFTAPDHYQSCYFLSQLSPQEELGDGLRPLAQDMFVYNNER